MGVLAELAKPAALVKRDRRGVVVAHLQGESVRRCGARKPRRPATAPGRRRGGRTAHRPRENRCAQPARPCAARPARSPPVRRRCRGDHRPMGRRRNSRNERRETRSLSNDSFSSRAIASRSRGRASRTLTLWRQVLMLKRSAPSAPPRTTSGYRPIGARACRLAQGAQVSWLNDMNQP